MKNNLPSFPLLLLPADADEGEMGRLVALHFHGAQLYGGKPYRVHLESAEAVLHRFGLATPKRIAAIWLHDTLEDTAATSETLARLGIAADVIEIVEAVTDGPGETRRERKAATYPKIAALREAVIVKLCDRIANVEAPGKLAMYEEEHATFRSALYDPAHELDDLWAYLDSLFE